MSSYYSNFSGGTAAARRVGVCLTRMPTYTLMHTNTNMKAPQGCAGRVGGGSGVGKKKRYLSSCSSHETRWMCSLYQNLSTLTHPGNIETNSLFYYMSCIQIIIKSRMFEPSYFIFIVTHWRLFLTPCGALQNTFLLFEI